MFRLWDKDTKDYFISAYSTENGTTIKGSEQYLEFETYEQASICLAAWHINAIKRKNAGQWLPSLNYEIREVPIETKSKKPSKTK